MHMYQEVVLKTFTFACIYFIAVHYALWGAPSHIMLDHTERSVYDFLL
jgi:hypothetical protein